VLSGTGLAAVLAACGLSGFGDPVEEPSGGLPPPGPQQGEGRGLPTTPAKVGKGETPNESGGPFPADGSNGRNVLVQRGIVRSDITHSFGVPAGVARGVPTTIALTLLNKSGHKVKPYRKAAIYLWHCDSLGRYSMYDQTIVNQNYLRGLQVTDRRGRVTFRSIFPAAYAGRWPHIHFEVYESERSATKTRRKLRTSQIALPEKACREVYATPEYPQSLAHLLQASLRTDTAFRDGYSTQMAKVTGSVEKGMRISLDITV
jgi:protocatechuate 3,4-dioxygenase beta subunit